MDLLGATLEKGLVHLLIIHLLSSLFPTHLGPPIMDWWPWMKWMKNGSEHIE